MIKIAMKKFAVVATAAVLIGTGVSGSVLARTIPANMGTARLGTQANLFNYSFITGAVTATGSADWALGLPGDSCGSKTVFVTSRATAAGASVRVVSNDGFGTAFAASAFAAIPVSGSYVQVAVGPVNLPCSGVLFLDAIMNGGASIDRTDYLP
jgi:hypothetical protein